MSFKSPPYIWHNGEVIDWADATVHVLTHALHYGSSVFEGIRVYNTPAGPAVFRLQDHIQRLFDSAKIYHMDIPWSVAEIVSGCKQIVQKNQLESAYIRPLMFRGYGNLGVVPGADIKTEGSIAAFNWGTYLGDNVLEEGVDACISSWTRLAPNTIPAMAKAGGNYLSSQLIGMEARRLGFHEGIGLSVDGMLSEGAGENLFLIRDSKIYTPPQAASILSGITRDSIFKLATQMDIEIIEQALPREMLYLADEAFFTGTAVEVTPIRSVDGIPLKHAGRGPITEKLQTAFFGLFNHQTEDQWDWLNYIQE